MSTLSTSENRQLESQPHGQVRALASRCEVVRDFSRLEALAPEWTRLWEADPQGEIFQSFLWNRAWWQACGAAVKLCTPIVFAGSELLGILPLVQRNGRLEFLGYPQADYGDVICAEASTVQVLESSLRELQKHGEWREGLLDGLPQESRIVRHAAKLPADVRGSVQLVASETCYTILLGDQPAGTLDSLARKQHLRRRQNKLEKAGKVVFRHLESLPEALHHLDLFFVCQRRRRAIHGKSSAAESAEFRELLRNLVQAFDLKEDLHFGVLELDGRPLAWHVSFEAHNKLVFYQQTFEVDAWDFAPGEALLRYLLLFAKGRVGREFDFTRGDEPFKARFANHGRTVYKLWVERRGIRGRVVGAARRAEGTILGWVRRARKAAKAEKGIFERWRFARAWWDEHVPWRAGNRMVSGNASGAEGRRQGFARYIWEDETVTVLAHGAGESDGPLDHGRGDTRVTPGGLGELVDFAQQNPHVISATQVLGLRERFRKGDRALIEWDGSHSVRVAWVATRPLGDVVRLPRIVPELEPSLIVYELWESKVLGSTEITVLLDGLVREARGLGLPLWICSKSASEGTWSEAERRGFQKRLEIRRRKLFGRTLRESVAGVPRGGANRAGSPPDPAR
jgi:CelD/BcsL family acetyltransferase involved in cellulose biosynthesis